MRVDAEAPLRICVAFSPAAGVVDETELLLPRGATVADALRASGLPQRHATVDLTLLTVGVWGRRCDTDAGLHDGDRVELYRPLQRDPKAARRERYRAQVASTSARPGDERP